MTAQTSAEIQRLRAEVQSDRRSFETHLRDLESLDLGSQASRGDVARAAVALHHGYSAIESLLTRVARQLEGSVPGGHDWHQALIDAMALDIEGIRPAILREETAQRLRPLLAFRHFFRHAYAVTLSAERLGQLRDDARAAAPLLREDLDRLDALLAEVANDTGSS